MWKKIAPYIFFVNMFIMIYVAIYYVNIPPYYGIIGKESNISTNIFVISYYIFCIFSYYIFYATRDKK